MIYYFILYTREFKSLCMVIIWKQINDEPDRCRTAMREIKFSIIKHLHTNPNFIEQGRRRLVNKPAPKI